MKIITCNFFLIIPAILTLTVTLSVPLPSKAGDGSFNTRLHSKDSILIKMQAGSKANKVRLFTDATQEMLFFSASGGQGKLFQLFMFDMDGRLVRQAQVLSTQTTFITGLEKGNYLLEVFSNDERIVSGSLTKK